MRAIRAHHIELVDLACERLVLGVASEVALFEHLEPAVGFLGRGNEIFSEGFFERRAWPAAFVSLSFEVKLERLPHDFKGELEALDGGVADEVAFRLGHGFREAGGDLSHVGLSLGESLFVHGWMFSGFRLVCIATEAEQVKCPSARVIDLFLDRSKMKTHLTGASRASRVRKDSLRFLYGLLFKFENAVPFATSAQ